MINKNILYFTRTMDIGGTEKVIMQLCRYFNKELNKIVVCSSGGVHETELAKLGIKHYKINDIEDKNPINMIKTLVEVYKIIKNENISIVHTHHRMAAFYTTILSNFLDFKFLHTAHNTFQNKRLLTKFSLHKANVIAVGEKVKNNLHELYKIDYSKLKVIYNGIEEYKGKIEAVPEIKKYRDKGYFLVANIGRLSEQKGMEYYIKSIPKVLNSCPKVMFYIIGDGEEREKLEKLSIDLNIKDNVIFLGYRNDVLNIIYQVDLIVLSSLWEGLPLTPIEAFSAGKTIVATDVDGTGEIVKNNYNGLLIDSANSEQISYSIIKIYNDIAQKKELELNALKTYNEKFSIDIFNNCYKNYYSKILSNS